MKTIVYFILVKNFCNNFVYVDSTFTLALQQAFLCGPPGELRDVACVLLACVCLYVESLYATLSAGSLSL